ncbi:hypothetical protein ISG33_14535 [Glaciecola sp. MH2013]|uniref:hypothetical protein n=1 Tax=Glaciecola sp. MH2013 TaxID=2785524 RepID=UPI00189E71C4|nr:hypothetical protein [Glaciecola sp. MH2013]MBF7074620.1 hypothetical protein [Glaciecola sp. MH2013]
MTRNEFIKACFSIAVIVLVLLLMVYALSHIAFSIATASLLVGVAFLALLIKVVSLKVKGAYSAFKETLSKHNLALLNTSEKLASFCFVLFAGVQIYQSYISNKYQTIGACFVILLMYALDTYREERAQENDG